MTNSPCIRNESRDACRGHECVSCGRTYYCGDPHRRCVIRPERVATGIIQHHSLAERLADGWKMLSDDEQ